MFAGRGRAGRGVLGRGGASFGRGRGGRGIPLQKRARKDFDAAKKEKKEVVDFDDF